jgi:hypothetical protein
MFYIYCFLCTLSFIYVIWTERNLVFLFYFNIYILFLSYKHFRTNFHVAFLFFHFMYHNHVITIICSLR